MTESGGRRIMREYTLKLDYIKPCTSEFLEKMKGFDVELSQFITIKQKQATEDKIANTENPDGLVNGTIDTNVGLLRAYMTIYLRRHPFISKDLLFMVRTLAPTETGYQCRSIVSPSIRTGLATNPFRLKLWNILYLYYLNLNCIRSKILVLEIISSVA